MKTHMLRNGDRMPAIGLGTWKSAPGVVRAAVKEAIRIGYRHIDCAPIYGNEREIGAALAECFEEGLASREEMWITSKLWNDRHAPGDVVPALEETLEHLRLDYLDLYLIHWPVAIRPGLMFPESGADMVPLEDVPLDATWGRMEAAVGAGLCRHIGVSNFSAAKIATLLDGARLPVEVDQVELHPYLRQDGLVSFCQAHDVVVTAYSPLGSRDRPERLKEDGEPVLLEDPVILGIADRVGATPAQVLIAWALARATAAIPKSTDPGRMRENLAAADVSLDEAAPREIAALDRHRRYIVGHVWAMEGSPYSLSGLWDEAGLVPG